MLGKFNRIYQKGGKMTSEVWLPVTMEGIKKNMYAVSSKGNMIGSRGRMKPRKMTTVINPNGGEITISTHKIVCTTFHGEKPHPKYSVDHIDQKPHNNNASNLRWASPQLQRANQTRSLTQNGYRVIHRDTIPILC